MKRLDDKRVSDWKGEEHGYQSDDLLSERYIDVADFARIGTN